jgi:hypothetical protein
MKPIPLTRGLATQVGADGWRMKSGYRAARGDMVVVRRMIRSQGNRQ